MLSKMKISVIIPTFNEEKAIKETIDEINYNLKDTNHEYEIIIINDGSTDKTSKILKSINKIKIINHSVNRGYGASLKSGIIESKYDYILITDADGTYPMGEIPNLIKNINGNDMVVGARTTTKNMTISKRLAKKIIVFLANIITKSKIPDINSGFRIFKKKDALKFFSLYPDGFSFTTTITLSFLINYHSIKYVPIQYNKRKGKSKMKPREFFRFLNLLINIMVYFNPLKIFSIISFSLFLLAIIIFLYSLFLLNDVLDITVTVILSSSLQMFILGLIADLIIKRSPRWKFCLLIYQ